MRGVCSVAMLASSTAAADEPISIMMDRGDDGVRADATVTLTPASSFGLRADGYLQYVDPRFHVGGYVTMPFEVSAPGNGFPASSAFGDLELGALYVAHVLAELRVVARVGVVLPTFDDPNAIGGDAGSTSSRSGRNTGSASRRRTSRSSYRSITTCRSRFRPR